MMKNCFKRIILLASLALLASSVSATVIGADAARTMAADFLKSRSHGMVAAANPKLHLVHTAKSALHADAVDYYVFNIGADDGYVITSGDDCVPVVLGYSDEGALDMTCIPANLQAWLDGYAEQIDYMRENGLMYQVPTQASTITEIRPMLTCYWNQNWPYNAQCPKDVDGRPCATGCVATAMAQLLYYHRDRNVSQTTHEIPDYITDTRHLNVSGIPAGTVLDWDNLVDRYPENATQEQMNAVATLMRVCGTAVRMDYTSGESSAHSYDVPRMLVAFFNYSSKIRVKGKSAYSNTGWETLLLNELKEGRPIYYTGRNASGGHAFICDGYQSGGYFHMNWGWGGDHGYFLVNITDSSNPVNTPFSYSQQAILNIEPRSSLPDPDAGIRFADPIVRGVCLLAGDSNDDGVLTTAEAAAVTDPEEFDFYHELITSFDEFRYFTGTSSIIDQAFIACERLKSITLPSSVKSIGEKAFITCYQLQDISFSTSLQTIGERAFEDCNKLDTIALPNSLRTIEAAAFMGCIDLKDVSLGIRVESIGDKAFSGCVNLKKFNIPAMVTHIGNNVFEKCRVLSDFTWDAVNYQGSFILPSSVQRLTIGDGVKLVPDNFARNTKLNQVTIGTSVTRIGNDAFFNCSGLTSVDLPESLTTIGDRAFLGCTGLTEMRLPGKVEIVGNEAFYSCTGLTSVQLPNSLTTIGDCAFWACSSLKSLTVPASVTSFGLDVLNGCESMTDFTWNAGNFTTSFTLPSSLQRLTFGDNIEAIPGALAQGLPLTKLTLGAAVKTIDDNAFRNCNQLTDITCMAPVPPTARQNVFTNYLQATLSVPAQALEAYRTTQPWSRFKNIEGIHEATGDVNVDGEINIADVNAVIDNILNDLFDALSDVNGDGEVNIADINAVIDIILGHN